jgi:triacylglycerol esterase/lipase EstA (alpha/beta hydrolase family)
LFNRKSKEIIKNILKSRHQVERIWLFTFMSSADEFNNGSSESTLKNLILKMNSEHLFVLIHGTDGFASDLDLLAKQLRITGFQVFQPAANEKYTGDGIINGAKRLAREIEDQIIVSHAKKISFVGHIVGGLYARYVVCLLFKNHIIPEKIVPANFICVETPHAGYGNSIWKFVGFMLKETTKDLLLIPRGNRKSVLHEMTNDLFFASLGLFEKFISYSSEPNTEKIDGQIEIPDVNSSSSSKMASSSLSVSKDNLYAEWEESTESTNLTEHLMKQMNKFPWQKLVFTQIVDNNFWITRMGVQVTTDIVNKVNSNPSISIKKKTIFSEPSETSILHLAVLIHGLVGFGRDLEFIGQKLKYRYPYSLKILLPECNQGKTHDGILNGAKRIFESIKVEIADKNIKYISLIGHSLGGLYARCLAGLMQQEGIIPHQLVPINFITLASPHLGSREHGKLFGEKVTSLVGNIIGKTGIELFLEDVEEGDPMLVKLTCGVYYSALEHFQRLSVYSNTKFDVPVHYSTAAIRKRAFKTTMEVSSLTLPTVIPDNYPDDDNNDEGVIKTEYMMLKRLNKLGWNRYAVIPTRPLLAHVDIVIKSEYWSKKHGYPVISHLVDRFRHPITINDEPCINCPKNNNYHHLILILPGRGSVAHELLYLAETIRDHFPRPEYKIVLASVNDNRHRDGIFEASKRILKLIKDEIHGTMISKISYICESSGGLYARHLLKLMKDEKLVPINYITISTPHLGIDLPSKAWSRIGQQLNLLDKERIVSEMARHDYVFHLKGFKNLVIYGNIKSDQNSTYKSSLIQGADNECTQDKFWRIVADKRTVKFSKEEALFNNLQSLEWKRFAIVPPKQLIYPAKFNYWVNENPLVIHIIKNIVD